MIAKFDTKVRNGDGQSLKDYYENGTNKDRDLKDNRVTLFGNLDILVANIKLAHNKGYKETYRNLVVSFSEDNVDIDELKDIALQYIKQYTIGYDEDEYEAYAEVHLPKQKYKENGKVRKPHIHISFSMFSSKLQKKLDLNHNGNRIYDIDLLTRKMELENGFNKPTLKPINSSSKYNSKNSNIRNDIKTQINSFIENSIVCIYSYEELLDTLKKKFNITIVNESSSNAKTKYITILHNDKKIRLKGNIFNVNTFNDARNELLKTLYEKESYIQKNNVNTTLNSDLSKVITKLEIYNKKRVEDINNRNKKAREQSEIFINKYNYYNINFSKKENTIGYQEKIFRAIYNVNINYNLNGYYIKQYNINSKPFTLIKNSSLNIYVKDYGNTITSNSTNTKEQVKLMLELAIAKKWDLSKLIITGSDEFKKEIKKQIVNINTSANNTNYKVYNVNKTKSLVTTKLFNLKQQKVLSKLGKYYVNTNPKVMLNHLNLSSVKYEIILDEKSNSYNIKCGSKIYKSNISFLVNEMNYNYKEAYKLLKNLYPDKEDNSKEFEDINTQKKFSRRSRYS